MIDKETLVWAEPQLARAKFAELACVSFTRGTRITLASGAQCPIEDIRVGDRVLTRDNGVQEVRWVSQQTVRATGAFAPIVISKGALNNARELRLSPNQRLFVYQRTDRLNAGQ
ncbi:MAG: Hint domain-containing protein, partial [Pseudomonadota bacterium]